MKIIKIPPIKTFTIIPKGKNTTKVVATNTTNNLVENVQGPTSQQVQPIEKSITKINTKNDIQDIVERPLVSTFEKFFEKNIQTVSSSANGTNIHIYLYYDTLSKNNKDIVKNPNLGGKISCSGRSGFRPLISFSLPPIITPTDYITRRGERIADHFETQQMIIQPSYTPEEFTKIILQKPGVTKQEIMQSREMDAYTYNPQQDRIQLKRM